MKIHLVITELDVGGAERCATDLAIYLQRQGHAVRVTALGTEPPAHRAGCVEQLHRCEVPVRFLRGRSPAQWMKVRHALYEQLSDDRADVIQSFLFHANVMCASLVRSFDMPLIGGARVADPRWLRRCASRWAARRMQKLVCVSDAVAVACQRFENVAVEKLVVIPNGIKVSSPTTSDMATDTNRRIEPTVASEMRRRGIDAGAPILMFVGRLEYQKGIDLLIARAPQLLQRLGRHQLLILGEGPLGESLRQMVARAGLQSRIHFVGWQDDPRAWMRAADLVLLPARYEGMPNVVLEAMAESRAVVCSQVEGVDQLLGENASEQTVPIDRIDRFIDCTVRLAEDTALRDRLARANYQRCWSHFRLEDQLAKYLRLYAQVALRTGRAAS